MSENGKHCLHVYTGDGKGKTTAAMGLALRGIGHGRRVLIAQFMKSGNSGELEALRQFENADVQTAPPITGFTFRMSEAERAETARQQSDFARSLIETINSARPEMIILDELNVAVHGGFVDESLASDLIDAALSSGETAVTGRNAPDLILARADYISEIHAVRHPYATEKLPARMGVEW